MGDHDLDDLLHVGHSLGDDRKRHRIFAAWVEAEVGGRRVGMTNEAPFRRAASLRRGLVMWWGRWERLPSGPLRDGPVQGGLTPHGGQGGTAGRAGRRAER
ncbi:hypothetical protein HNR30_007641 [Nonomuraea soli]|uniref:Uncharacterized protein n=1 Tax=Nonomuraea soli TaxID=1032476 RepID=A0A7W0CS47_9ACTN|nr:hypothetical protein [Nonomuraea soli]